MKKVFKSIAIATLIMIAFAIIGSGAFLMLKFYPVISIGVILLIFLFVIAGDIYEDLDN